jgi:hypothetical protein
MEFPLAQVFWLVTSDLDGRSAAAANKARESVEHAVEKVRQSCDRVPAAMVALRRRVREATVAPLDARGVRTLENAFALWVRASGAGPNFLQGATAGVRTCERLSHLVRAGYALWWEYSPTGKRWWVDLQVDNETDKGYLLELGGTLWVTGLVDPRPDRFMARDKRRGGRKLFWGGSSADFMTARPLTTTSKRVVPAATEFVYTTSQGTVYYVRPEVFMRHDGENCSLPVPRLN